MGTTINGWETSLLPGYSIVAVADKADNGLCPSILKEKTFTTAWHFTYLQWLPNLLLWTLLVILGTQNFVKTAGTIVIIKIQMFYKKVLSEIYWPITVGHSKLWWHVSYICFSFTHTNCSWKRMNLKLGIKAD